MDPLSSTLSLRLQIGHQIPDVAISVRQLASETNHTCTVDTTRNGIEDFLVTAAVEPVTVRQIRCITRSPIMAIASTGSRVDQLTALQRCRIIQQRGRRRGGLAKV
jgi:hypothetical protein